MTDTFFGISRRKFTDDELKLLATVVADGVAQQARIDELTEALQHLVDLDEMDTTTTMEQEGIDKARAALKEPKE